MGYSENIERIFFDDVREKKRTGIGVFKKRGKGVKHGISGALRTEYFYMKSRDRKKLNGECVISNMYDTILRKEEFFTKDIATQKNMLMHWRELHSNEELKKLMGLNNSQFYKLCKDLELPGKQNVKKPKRGTAKIVKNEVAAIQEIPVQEPVHNEVKQILITQGLHLEYNGEFTAEELNKIFTKLQLITDGELNKFNVSISLSERA